MKEHEEFYQNKVGLNWDTSTFSKSSEMTTGADILKLYLQAKEWKNRCLKYERALVSNKVHFKTGICLKSSLCLFLIC